MGLGAHSPDARSGTVERHVSESVLCRRCYCVWYCFGIAECVPFATFFFWLHFGKGKLKKKTIPQTFHVEHTFLVLFLKLQKKKIKIKKLLCSFGVYSILSPKYRKKEGNWFLTPSHPRWLCQGKGEYEKGDILVHFLKKYY